jgi:hypothetical protein
VLQGWVKHTEGKTGSKKKRRREKKGEGKNEAPATILNKNEFHPHSAAKTIKPIKHKQEVS